MSLLAIEGLIISEIQKLQQKPNYYASMESEATQLLILVALESGYGFDYAKDQLLVEYCLKATEVEIWEYYLSVVLPSLSSSKALSS